MGNNTLPPFTRISIDDAKNIVVNQQGYAHKAYAELRMALEVGEAVVMSFSSVSAANKQLRNIAGYAQENGFDLLTHRRGPVVAMWLELRKSDG